MENAFVIIQKNGALFWFGVVNIGLFMMAFLLHMWDVRLVNGEPVWVKPMKFALSVWILCWTLSPILEATNNEMLTKAIVWITLITLSIEQIAIFSQAARGVMSHFNVFNGVYNLILFQLMAVAITIFTLAIGYLAYMYFVLPIALPGAVVWGIRLGLIGFVLFSFEGFVMGALLKHSVGEAANERYVPFLGWSVSVGDLRVAHFIGIHSLQLIPLVAIAVASLPPGVYITAIWAAVYYLFSAGMFILAMQGKPFTAILLGNLTQ